jgi:uncharacterized protein
MDEILDIQPNIVIGREAEVEKLTSLLYNNSANLMVMYGRRRVGKSYLIKTVFANKIMFQFTGVHHVKDEIQMQEFCKELQKQCKLKYTLTNLTNWFDIFAAFATILHSKRNSKKKIIVVLDEFPWMETVSNNFLAAFEHFWEQRVSTQQNVAIILCGSAAGWMLKNIINNRGGLYNRITHTILLEPFNLYETELFLKHKKIFLNHYQISQLYMAWGGIPHYLNQAKAGYSATQLIDKICFDKQGELYNEFAELFKSLFANAEKNLSIIYKLAEKPQGLTRTQLLKLCKMQSGGTATDLLDELKACGFINTYIPFGKVVKDSIYKLVDEFILFYIKFMAPNRNAGVGTWQILYETQAWKSWSGLAFETMCQKHLFAIKQHLAIAGIYTTDAAWKSKDSKAQIDLVIDRNDKCINLCEMKYYEEQFTLSAKMATALLHKKILFKQETKTRKQIFWILISPYKTIHNQHSLGLVEHIICMPDLFINKRRM